MSTTLRIALVLAGALTLGMPVCAAAQDVERTANNVIYAEALGNAVTLSLNYERFMTNDLAVRVGINALGGDGEDDETSIFIVPVMLTYLAGRGSSHAEFGVGAGFASGSLDFGTLGDLEFDGVYATGTLGYRYQRPEGGFVARAGFTPLLIADVLWPWFGLSVGYAF